MLGKRIAARSLGVGKVLVESSRFEPDSDPEAGAGAGAVVFSVRAHKWAQGRCGVCQRRCPGYDQGRRECRRWRSLDVGTLPAYLEADVSRVSCDVHGVITEWVPWACHGARHTLAFDRQVAWHTTRMSKTAVAKLLRVSWTTVGKIITRVMADVVPDPVVRLANLERIGIDEISYLRGFKFLTVVVDHDTRTVLWVGEGRSKAVLSRFFTELGPERCARIKLVSADGADWIFHAVQDHLPNAKLCLDPFHVVSWATKALDETRRTMWSNAKRNGLRLAAGDLRGARYALLKNPGRLNSRQTITLASIQKTNKPLYRAYLLKEQLRLVFAAKGGAERAGLLDAWLRWAARSKIPDFVDLARRIRTYFRTDIVNTLTHRLSNGLIEGTNTKIRLLTRTAFGFKNVDALIALIKLHLGGYNITLPGRT